VIEEEGKVFLRVRSGKGQKERLVPVIDKEVAWELLKLSKEKGKDFLFGVKAGTLKDYAYKVKRASGVDFHSHRLRHTLATRLLAKGISIDVVQKVLGHASINTTRRYAETLPERVKELAVDVFRQDVFRQKREPEGSLEASPLAKGPKRPVMISWSIYKRR